MVECKEVDKGQDNQGCGLASDDVLYGLGIIQYHIVPPVKFGRERNRRRGPVPRTINVDSDSRQTCYVCKESKSLEKFSADRSRPNGVMSRCKKCNNARVHAYYRTPQGRAQYRRKQLMRDYGLSVQDYETLVVVQQGKCAICKQSPQHSLRGQFYVDHDHSTKKVRGLLCGTCNSALGLFKEDVIIIFSAIQYLQKHLESDDPVAKRVC